MKIQRMDTAATTRPTLLFRAGKPSQFDALVADLDARDREHHAPARARQAARDFNVASARLAEVRRRGTLESRAAAEIEALLRADKPIPADLQDALDGAWQMTQHGDAHGSR